MVDTAVVAVGVAAASEALSTVVMAAAATAAVATAEAEVAVAAGGETTSLCCSHYAPSCFSRRKYVSVSLCPPFLLWSCLPASSSSQVLSSAFYFWTMRCSHIIAVSLHLLLIVYCRAHLIVCFHSSLHASVDEGHPRA